MKLRCNNGKPLARAGKVKGQTPKKKKKKKKTRGRAHKRMQYNRRFFTAGNILTKKVLFTPLSLSKYMNLVPNSKITNLRRKATIMVMEEKEEQ